jgi:hypothetical protein
MNATLSADTRSATACFPDAPGLGTGDVFCFRSGSQHVKSINVWHMVKKRNTAAAHGKKIQAVQN